MEKEYKRTYTGFFLWLLCYVVSLGIAAKVSAGMTENNAVLLTFSVTIIMLDILLYIIYITENIYWINGVSYNDAKNATHEERKVYAQEHLRKFVNATFLWGIYVVAKCFTGIPMWVDIVTFLVILITAAVSTIKIKL